MIKRNTMIGEIRRWKDDFRVQSDYRGKIFIVLSEADDSNHIKCLFEDRVMIWPTKFARQNSKKAK